MIIESCLIISMDLKICILYLMARVELNAVQIWCVITFTNCLKILKLWARMRFCWDNPSDPDHVN